MLYAKCAEPDDEVENSARGVHIHFVALLDRGCWNVGSAQTSWLGQASGNEPRDTPDTTRIFATRTAARYHQSVSLPAK